MPKSRAKQAEPEKKKRASRAAAAKPLVKAPAKKPAARAKLPAKPIAKKPPAKKPIAKKRKPTAKKPKPKAAPLHAPDAKELELIKRREKILDLREGGASIRQISEHLTAQGVEGCSPTRVHELLAEALDDMLKNQRLKTKQIVQLEINKLDRVELTVSPKLLKATDADSIEKLSRSMERVWKRRDALLGLTKPEKHEHTGADGAPLDTSIRVILPALTVMPENLTPDTESE
jgi:hypothetical protein